jgi:hypothetical protein
MNIFNITTYAAHKIWKYRPRKHCTTVIQISLSYICLISSFSFSIDVYFMALSCIWGWYGLLHAFIQAWKWANLYGQYTSALGQRVYSVCYCNLCVDDWLWERQVLQWIFSLFFMFMLFAAAVGSTWNVKFLPIFVYLKFVLGGGGGVLNLRWDNWICRNWNLPTNHTGLTVMWGLWWTRASVWPLERLPLWGNDVGGLMSLFNPRGGEMVRFWGLKCS